MSGEIEAFLEEQGLGQPERRLRLGGRLSFGAAPPLAVELCLTRAGTWLVACESRFAGHTLDACDPGRVRYERGRLTDRLRVNDQTLSVATGRASEARRLIALGRLRKARLPGAARARLLTRDRYLNRDDELVAALLPSLLTDDEELLALLEVSEDEVVSAHGATVARRHYFVLGAQSACFATLSELGDQTKRLLDASQLQLETQDGARLGDGESSLVVQEKQKGVLAELCELARMAPGLRLFEAARRLHVLGEAARVRALLAAAQRRGAAQALLFELTLDVAANTPISADDLTHALAQLRAASVSDDELSESYRRWHLPLSVGRELAARLSSHGAEAEPYALSLHRTLRAAAAADRGTPDEELVRWDIELAEHELVSGDPQRARGIAENQLRRLAPDEGAVEAPAQLSPAHLARSRLLEVLTREARLRQADDVAALAALARLEPLSEARLRALVAARGDDAETGALVTRAQRVLDLLAAGGLSSEPRGSGSEDSFAFDRATLEQRLRHPLARGSGRLAARLSELVAAVPEPDLGFLRDFCEELSRSRHADAARALTRATRILGLPSVSAYVSHGARSVGLRAFGSSEPFVLIGERHLASDSPYLLRGSELDFALGAELAHLAFGHQRVTAGEVWAGAAGKTKNALAALGFMLPVVVDLGGPRTQRLLGKLGAEAFERATRGALQLPELFAPRVESRAEPLSQRNEELIVAHRLVQLSADRAGLAIARDLGGTLRAMLLTRSDYRELLQGAEHHGLVAALEARRSHSPAFADLWLRVRAVIAFYLSPELDPLWPSSA
ncbi:MAG: hypothetical protein QM756_17635 [Polyangiaceae bacterium]